MKKMALLILRVMDDTLRHYTLPPGVQGPEQFPYMAEARRNDAPFRWYLGFVQGIVDKICNPPCMKPEPVTEPSPEPQGVTIPGPSLIPDSTWWEDLGIGAAAGATAAGLWWLLQKGGRVLSWGTRVLVPPMLIPPKGPHGEEIA